MPRAKKKTEDEEIEDLIEDLDEDEDTEDEELEEDDEELEDEDEEEEDEEEEDEEDEEEEDDEDEEVDDEDEEDPDEAPVKARSRSRTKKTAPKREKVERTGIGTAELAEAAGIESRVLRMYLRAKGFEKTDGRYEWKSLNDPQAKQILKGLRDKEHKVIQKERLDEMKANKAKSNSKSSAKTPAKKTTRAKAAATKTTTRRKR